MALPLARPLSIDPVLDRLADTPCSRGCAHLGCMRAVAERVGRSRRAVHRWKREGLTVHLAEHIAAALQTHPAELWGPCAWGLALEEHETFLNRDDDALEELDEDDVAFALEVLA